MTDALASQAQTLAVIAKLSWPQEWGQPIFAANNDEAPIQIKLCEMRRLRTVGGRTAPSHDAVDLPGLCSKREARIIVPTSYLGSHTITDGAPC